MSRGPYPRVQGYTCARCPSPDPPVERCARCRKRLAAYQREYRAKHKHAGLCQECSAPALPGRSYCEKHQASHAQRGAGYASYTCDKCPSQMRPIVRCEACARARAAADRRSRHKRSDAGLCPDCGAPATAGFLRCAACRKTRADATRERRHRAG